MDTGRAFAVEAKSLEVEFSKRGVPPEAIDAAVTALEEAARNGSNARAARRGAIDKWRATFDETMLGVKSLDVLVETTITAPDRPAKYAVARTPRRISGRKAVESKPPEAAPTATTAALQDARREIDLAPAGKRGMIAAFHCESRD